MDNNLTLSQSIEIFLDNGISNSKRVKKYIESLFVGNDITDNTFYSENEYIDLPEEEREIDKTEKELLEAQNLKSDNNETLYFKHSFLINPYRNNYDKDADFRFDNYDISHLLQENIRYYDFLKLITPNILTYILKTLSNAENPIKYTFVIHNENNKISYSYIRNIKTFSPALAIYLPTTKNISSSTLMDEIHTSIIHENYTDHDWLFSSDNNDTLTIIQERLTKPFHLTDEFHTSHYKKLSKSFKEDKCIICFESKPNILFCNCGHLNLCESCYNNLENNKCPKCRLHNAIFRRL